MTPADLDLLRVIAEPKSWQIVYAYMAYDRLAATHEERLTQSWDACPSLLEDMGDERRVTARVRRLKAAGLVELGPVNPDRQTRRRWLATDAGRAAIKAGEVTDGPR